MEISEYLLSITGSASISEGLEADTEYLLQTTITPYGSDLRSNNDGSFNKKYKAKITDVAVLTKGEKVITGKDKSRKSQKLRGAIYHEGEEYEEIMDLIIPNVREVIDYLKNK